MKKNKILIFAILFSSILGCTINETNNSPNNASQNELITICKFWGFLKYYHPAIGSGQINWDSTLIVKLSAILDTCKNVNTNELLEEMMPLQWHNTDTGLERSYSCEGAPFASNADFRFLYDTIFFSPKIIKYMNHLYLNKSPYRNIYVTPNRYAHHASFEQDTLYFSTDSVSSVEIRLLGLFRFWNSVNYFYPYKYLIGNDWENVLKESIPEFVGANTALEYNHAIRKLIAKVNDNHVYAKSDVLSSFYGKNWLPFYIKTIEGKSVIYKLVSDSLGKVYGIKKGDVILSINGETIASIQDSLKDYISVSNQITALEKTNHYMSRFKDSSILVKFQRGDTIFERVIGENAQPYYTIFYDNENKTRAAKQIDSNIHYVNLSLVKPEEVDSLFSSLINSDILILDLRRNCEFILYDVCGYLLSNSKDFYSTMTPDYNFPGFFRINTGRKLEPNNNCKHFDGTLILLINERTQSIGEFTTMALQQYHNTVLIGSSTAGADGNVTYIYLPGGIRINITGLGIYYPDFGQTQRIGIKPEIYLLPTLKGLLHYNDEVLEKLMDKADQYVL